MHLDADEYPLVKPDDDSSSLHLLPRARHCEVCPSTEGIGTDHQQANRSIVEPNNAPMARAASSSPNLLPHGLFTTRQRLQFGLHNAASTHSTSVRFSMGTHEDRPGALSQVTMDLVTILPASEDLGFSRALGPRRYTIGTMRR